MDVYKEIKLTSKNAMLQMSGLANSHFRIEISVDEFGIPSASSHILTDEDLRRELLTQRYVVSCSLFTGDVRICNQTKQDQRMFKISFDKCMFFCIFVQKCIFVYLYVYTYVFLYINTYLCAYSYASVCL